MLPWNEPAGFFNSDEKGGKFRIFDLPAMARKKRKDVAVPSFSFSFIMVEGISGGGIRMRAT
jgi:hypothetical protein